MKTSLNPSLDFIPTKCSSFTDSSCPFDSNSIMIAVAAAPTAAPLQTAPSKYFFLKMLPSIFFLPFSSIYIGMLLANMKSYPSFHSRMHDDDDNIGCCS